MACLLCVPAFAADDEPKGVSDIKEVGKVIRNPITIEATSGKQMDVVFATRRTGASVARPAPRAAADIDAKYVSRRSEECHRAPWRRRRPEPLQAFRQGQSFLHAVAT
ncbi:MAG: hypothetical protein ACLT2T_17990 [Bilophila wadsworthia]